MDEDKITTLLESFRATLQDVVVQIATLTASIALDKEHRSDKEREYERRLENHGDRLRELEAESNQRKDLTEDVKALTKSVSELKSSVDKTSWLPIVATGMLTAVASGVIMFFISQMGVSS